MWVRGEDTDYHALQDELHYLGVRGGPIFAGRFADTGNESASEFSNSVVLTKGRGHHWSWCEVVGGGLVLVGSGWRGGKSSTVTGREAVCVPVFGSCIGNTMQVPIWNDIFFCHGSVLAVEVVNSPLDIGDIVVMAEGIVVAVSRYDSVLPRLV